jgi:hypothetical protein
MLHLGILLFSPRLSHGIISARRISFEIITTQLDEPEPSLARPATMQGIASQTAIFLKVLEASFAHLPKQNSDGNM